MGRCVTIPVPDGGVPRDAPALADVGFFDLGARDVPPEEPDAGAKLDVATDDGLVTAYETRDGCGCRVGAPPPSGGVVGLLAVLGAALAGRRRQRFGAKRSRSRRP